MNAVVAIVDAYLQINGYFAIAEYPLVKRIHRHQARTVTDIDLLAFRFPRAGCHDGEHRPIRGFVVEDLDPRLQAPVDRPDMLFCEVKEGRAYFNDAGNDPEVIEAVLERFGRCSLEAIPATADALVKHGHVTTHGGHSLRIVASRSGGVCAGTSRHLVLDLDHVLCFVRTYLNEQWDYLRHTQFTHPALAFLALIEKIEASGSETQAARATSGKGVSAHE
jgi:hypothetical protein